jgi:ADP-ribose pyrophosphatase YjhB (NUDIX family)
MYLTSQTLRDLEQRYGSPLTGRAEAPFGAREFALLEYCARKQRAHDVTLLIRDSAGRFAVIRKPSYPAEVFRPPSGGVEPGEAFEAGALREAVEETGLSVRLERYLVRVEARFTHGDAVAPWTTHVFLAEALDATLAPTDHVEIAEARWATVAEIMDEFRPRMLALGSTGMRYRVDLQDLALEQLGLIPPQAPELIRRVGPAPAASGNAF